MNTSLPTQNNSEAERLASVLSEASLAEALSLWRRKTTGAWSDSSLLFAKLAERLLALGEPLIAYDVASEGLRQFAGEIRLRQLLALALARSGATLKANAVLLELVGEANGDEETLGLLARTYKDLGLRSTNLQGRVKALREARDYYLEAYRLTDGYWTGINAATLSLLINETEMASRVAGKVREQALSLWSSNGENGSGRFWLECTLGEAALVLGELTEAEDWYRRARTSGPTRYADLSSAKRNARLILEHRQADWDSVAVVFRVPRVGVFTGHMIDAPNRTNPRFPSRLQDEVKQQLRHRIQTLDIGFGYASAACGSDILFLEALQELGREAAIVLPYKAEQFRWDSVDILQTEAWGERFERSLAAASSVTVASSLRLADGAASFEYGNRYLEGLAGLRARRLDTEMIGIAVWDGEETGALGGTSETIAQWQRSGLTAEIVDLAELRRQFGIDLGRGNPAEPSPAPPVHASPSEFVPVIRALLFADAVRYSTLREDQIPGFVRRFLGTIAELIQSIERRPLCQNTWGDALYLGFERVCDAARFGLELQTLLAKRNSETTPPDEPVNLRIALHAGPVYECFDPILNRMTYVGTHVSRTARMEPITPPGEIYVSEAFAALAAAEGASEFVCEYVGQIPQAKGFGTFPTYILRRQNQE
jgi:class 3 adenylate cyclase/tetratricopeptide (TPR) repeat protein